MRPSARNSRLWRRRDKLPQGSVVVRVGAGAQIDSTGSEKALAADAAHTRAGGGFVAVERQRALIVFQRLLAVAFFLIGKAEARPGFGVLVVDIERGVEVLDRLVVFAQGQQA